MFLPMCTAHCPVKIGTASFVRDGQYLVSQIDQIDCRTWKHAQMFRTEIKTAKNWHTRCAKWCKNDNLTKILTTNHDNQFWQPIVTTNRDNQSWQTILTTSLDFQPWLSHLTVVCNGYHNTFESSGIWYFQPWLGHAEEWLIHWLWTSYETFCQLN